MTLLSAVFVPQPDPETETVHAPKQTARELLAGLVGAFEFDEDRNDGVSTRTYDALAKARALLAELDAAGLGGVTRPHNDDLDESDLSLRRGINLGWKLGAERTRERCAKMVHDRALLLYGGGKEAARNAHVLRLAVLATPLSGSREERAKTTVEIDE